jgi:putative ABC transport system permease protein
MRIADQGWMATTAILRSPLRTTMMLIATAIGVSAVLMLTSLGEGARNFVAGEFKSLGTNLLMVLPGKIETAGGGMPGAMGGSPRDLTLDDVIAIARGRHVAAVAPVIPGAATISYDGRERDIDVLGTSAAFASIRGVRAAAGQFLPETELDLATPVAVIGETLRSELFDNASSLGEWVRVGDRRFRIIGVMRDAGTVATINIDEALFIPVASAQQLFNTQGVFRLLVETKNEAVMDAARRELIRTVEARHYGNDDITVVTQDAVLDTFNTIFNALSAALAGIAAISLVVAGTLIMNVMLVAVSQRTQEIGLMKALGARRKQIISLFLLESALLSLLGAILGVIVGQLAVAGLNSIYPSIAFRAPTWAIIAAVTTALASGLIFGIMPARRASQLDPVEALSGR